MSHYLYICIPIVSICVWAVGYGIVLCQPKNVCDAPHCHKGINCNSLQPEQWTVCIFCRHLRVCSHDSHTNEVIKMKECILRGWRSTEARAAYSYFLRFRTTTLIQLSVGTSFVACRMVQWQPMHCRCSSADTHQCGALTGNAKLTLNWISFENNFWNVFTFAMRWKLKRRHRAPVNILIYWAQSSIRVSGVSGGFNFSRRCECEIHSKWQRHASTTFFYEFFRIPLRRICWIRFHLQVPII